MAANLRLGYYAHHRDNKHTECLEADDSGVLDPAILDGDIMQSPPGSAHFGRKDSFASNGVLSPADSHGWHSLPVDHAVTGAPYHDDHSGFVVRAGPPHSHPSAYGPQPHHPPWALGHTSGDCTPARGIEYIPQPPPPQFFAQHGPEDSHAGFAHQHVPQTAHAPFNAPAEPSFIPAPQVQTPMSPHSHHDWMVFAQQEHESRPMPKRMRPNSPPIPVLDFARRDGIRKKNGRIDIPAERNIHTIDELIDKTTDDDTLKELKQQKRLLRNREAALASRQRKKKHTEDLEVKEKSYTQQIGTLEKDMQDMQLGYQQRERDMMHQLQESHRVIESLQEDIRNMRLQHNEETSSLRRKVNVLTDQVEACAAPAMSAAPSSTGYTDLVDHMNSNLHLDTYPWDSEDPFGQPLLRTDFDEDWTPLEIPTEPSTSTHSPAVQKRPSASTMVGSSPSKASSGGIDQPIASGLLFMLLLCGAFVASKPAKSQPADMPKMPAEVRAAAPTVLNNLLSEASNCANIPAISSFHHTDPEPQPSGALLTGSRGGSRLDQLHRRITSPTKQQEIDHAAQLTTAQYASISNMNYDNYNDLQGNLPALSGPRRNLADILSNMQQEHRQSSKAEVYTRSLLWDQIPTDVVRQFKEMVRDHDEIDARQKQRAGQNDDMYGFKHEH